ncbi:MAG: putative M18 family aminopeptidase 1 [Myxococcota bacterium]|nr:putative M18 family aminopeptidase 1 [Myxococcota bacterium]
MNSRYGVFAAVSMVGVLALLPPARAGDRQSIAAGMAAEYMDWIYAGKTASTFLHKARLEAEKLGFRTINLRRAAQGDLRIVSGDRLVIINRGHSGLFIRVGKRPLSGGVRLIATHHDTPAFPLNFSKPAEFSGGFTVDAFSHGGVKQWQWVGRPLALHGMITRGGVDQVISAGEFPASGHLIVMPQVLTEPPPPTPVYGDWNAPLPVTLFAPGAAPKEGGTPDSWLKELGVTPGEFRQGEFWAVPAGRPVTLGKDSELVGGFGHDDRACSFVALKSLFQLEDPEYTAIVYLTDREEAGGDGAVGAQSRWFRRAIMELMQAQRSGADGPDYRQAMARSFAISGDVTGGSEPWFESVYDKQNSLRLGQGAAFIRYTGSGGKFNGAEPDSCYASSLGAVFDAAGVKWRTVIIGRVDEGGGATIAAIMAEEGMPVADVGLPTISMHAPFELIHRGDLAELARAYAAFFQSNQLGKAPCEKSSSSP